ncbi:cysteine proteinase [Rickenella mellea]|uniref:Ubiquitin carboxyl-terminal hydrolase n=1 Tax=Rickenella mellea TaxID=50990 RepID=A0A4Y7PWE4_9AGAM|nr:cysteine proteinase [Rickenella mellea]
MPIGKWMPFGAGQATNHNHANTVRDPKLTTPEYKQFGFENFGNTCYANSVLQALYFCHPFRDLVLQTPDNSVPINVVPAPPQPPPPQTPLRVKNTRKNSTPDVRVGGDTTTANGTAVQSTGPPIPPTPPTLFSALRSLFLHISSNSADKGTVAPRAFVEKVKKENEHFRSTMHQDAHEFLNYLLNKVSEELEEDARSRSRNSSGEDLSHSTTTNSSAGPSNGAVSSSSSQSTTLVHNLFEGVLTSETRCLTCETVSSRDESFLDLSIDIEQNSSVTACLRQFSASEMLCQKNKFFCDSCCGLQEAEKRMKIKKLPNVLALHLKRFKFQEDVQKYIKLAYRVAFPLELRLFNTVDDAEDPDRLYELFAIVVHIGNGPHHGHYVAIVRSRGSWVLFDDDTVDTIKESDIPKYFGESNSGAAYVLYYQAVDLDPVSLGLRPASAVQPQIVVNGHTRANDASGTSPLSSPHASSPVFTPAFPPGLAAEELPDSDAETPLLPPATIPATPPLTAQVPPLAISISSSTKLFAPPLTVTIPPTDSPIITPSASGSSSHTTAPPPPPASAPPVAKPTGFFQSLRHSPSVRGSQRSSIHSTSVSVSQPPLPPLPGSPPAVTQTLPQTTPQASASVTSPRTNHKEMEPSSDPPTRIMSPSPVITASTSAPVTTPLTNGRTPRPPKDKDKGGGGGWFKRLSMRAEKTQETVSLPPPPPSARVDRGGHFQRLPDAPSTSSSTRSGHDPTLRAPPLGLGIGQSEGSVGSASGSSDFTSELPPGRGSGSLSFPSLPQANANSSSVPLSPTSVSPTSRPTTKTPTATPIPITRSSPRMPPSPQLRSPSPPRSPRRKGSHPVLSSPLTSPSPPNVLLPRPQTQVEPEREDHAVRLTKRPPRKISLTGNMLGFGRRDKDKG